MYKKGETVRVICLKDETSNSKYLQQIGVITGLIADDHGATKDDPLYDIKFFGDDGQEQYWGEELIKEEEV